MMIERRRRAEARLSLYTQRLYTDVYSLSRAGRAQASMSGLMTLMMMSVMSVVSMTVMI